MDESVSEPQGARFLVLSDSQASYSHGPSLEPLRRVVTGNHSILLISRKSEIAKSVRGPKPQGFLAEDVSVESYLAQKILVT